VFSHKRASWQLAELNFAPKIGNRLVKDGYTPRTWHSHPLHLGPPEPYDPAHPGTRATLDWIFLISALNFNFWSHLNGSDDCFGVEWREGWDNERRMVHTGYWSLVAALDRGKFSHLCVCLPQWILMTNDCTFTTLAV
jgi:Potential Queuosine, Q, salvage protein family